MNLTVRARAILVFCGFCFGLRDVFVDLQLLKNEFELKMTLTQIANPNMHAKRRKRKLNG